MIKKILITVITGILFLLINASVVLANHIGAFDICIPTDPTNHCISNYSCRTSRSDPTTSLCQPSVVELGAYEICNPSDTTIRCITGYSCQPSKSDPKTSLCQPDPFGEIFGKIQPPPAINDFIGTDPTGAGGISKFLTNLVALIYSLAAIVLIFMLIWGAFDWMTSGGEKEKLESARNKIISALVGIMLFAVAFAVIQVLGTFTGFTFFSGQTRPQSPTNSQPSNSCTIGLKACLSRNIADPDKQSECQEAYQKCLIPNL